MAADFLKREQYTFYFWSRRPWIRPPGKKKELLKKSSGLLLYAMYKESPSY